MIVRAIRGLAAATVLLVAISGTAQAQTSTESRFGVSAGVGVPMGDFADVAKMGFIVGGQFTMPLGEILKLRLSADYSRYGFHDDVVALLGDGNWTKLGAMANVVYPIGEMGVYGLGGLGFYSVNTDLSGSNAESDLAWDLGLGIGKNRWFVEARYQSIMSDPNLTSLPIVFGLKF